MDSSRLQPAQVEELRRLVARQLNFHGRLVRRMEGLGFPPDDPLYRAATASYHGLLELHVAIHYCGCAGGVAAPPRTTVPAPSAPVQPVRQHDDSVPDP